MYGVRLSVASAYRHRRCHQERQRTSCYERLCLPLHQDREAVHIHHCGSCKIVPFTSPCSTPRLVRYTRIDHAQYRRGMFIVTPTHLRPNSSTYPSISSHDAASELVSKHSRSLYSSHDSLVVITSQQHLLHPVTLRGREHDENAGRLGFYGLSTKITVHGNHAASVNGVFGDPVGILYG